MKTVWNVTVSLMNGTVCLKRHSDLFLSEELANEVAEKIKLVNKNLDFPVIVTIEHCTLYETREEIPILNKKEDE